MPGDAAAVDREAQPSKLVTDPLRGADRRPTSHRWPGPPGAARSSTGCMPPRSSGSSLGRRLRRAGAFTIFGIRPRVYGSRSAWMSSRSRPGWGHVSIATTNIYLHHLGTSADKAGLDRLNRRGHAGGTPREAGTE
jgi:hypothetical protein